MVSFDKYLYASRVNNEWHKCEGGMFESLILLFDIKHICLMKIENHVL
jgi:hypothetical protein